MKFCKNTKCRIIFFKFIYIFSIFYGINISFSQIQWLKTNGPHGGNILQFAMNNKNEVFLLANNIYSLKNDYSEWILKYNIKFENYNDFGNPKIISFNKDTLYVGSITFIYSTLDSGKTWKKIFNDGDIALNPLTIRFDKNGFIYLGGIGVFYRFRYNDANWKKIKYSGISIDARSIIIDSKNKIFTCGYSGLYYSTNSFDDIFRISEEHYTALAKNSEDHIFASISQDPFNNDLKKSTDGGNTWKSIYKGLNPRIIKCITVDSLDNIFVGTDTNGVYLSKDVGNTWEQTGLKKGIINTLLTRNNGEVFAGTEDMGVCYSKDYGKTWTILNNGIYMSGWIGSALSATRNDCLFSGYSLGGVFRSTNGGNSWEQKNNGIDIPYISCFYERQDKTLFAGSLKGLFRSKDNGETWEKINNGIYPYTQIYNIIEDKAGTLYLSCGGDCPPPCSSNGVLRSKNNGDTWESTGLDYFISNVIINRKGDLYATGGVYGGAGLFRSTNNGTTWDKLNLSAQASLLASNSKNHIFAKTYDFSIGDALYLSTDDGLSWKKKIDFSRKAAIRDIYIARNDDVFLSTSKGLYRSTDNGNTWEILDNGMKDITVSRVTIDQKDIMYCLTSEGVYKSSGPVLKSPAWKTNYPNTIQLNQNYPNPFNPSTSISYKLPVSSYVKMDIYNVLGEEIKTLVNKAQPQGIYTIEWKPETNKRNLPGGVYFYRLQSGNFSEMKKMIYLK